MRYESLKRKSNIINLLKMGACQDVVCLADKLDVSPRTIKRDIQELKAMGADINFSKSCNSYILGNAFDFESQLRNFL